MKDVRGFAGKGDGHCAPPARDLRHCALPFPCSPTTNLWMTMKLRNCRHPSFPQPEPLERRLAATTPLHVSLVENQLCSLAWPVARPAEKPALVYCSHKLASVPTGQVASNRCNALCSRVFSSTSSACSRSDAIRTHSLMKAPVLSLARPSRFEDPDYQGRRGPACVSPQNGGSCGDAEGESARAAFPRSANRWELEDRREGSLALN